MPYHAIVPYHSAIPYHSTNYQTILHLLGPALAREWCFLSIIYRPIFARGRIKWYPAALTLKKKKTDIHKVTYWIKLTLHPEPPLGSNWPVYPPSPICTLMYVSTPLPNSVNGWPRPFTHRNNPKFKLSNLGLKRCS